MGTIVALEALKQGTPYTLSTWLVICCCVFMAGLFIQDCFNKESWVRGNFRLLRRLFLIEGVHLINQEKDGYKWVNVRVSLKFLKTRGVSKIVFEVDSAINVKHAREQYVLSSLVSQSLNKNQKCDFVIATIPYEAPTGLSAGYICWGEKHRKSGDVVGIKPLSAESILKIKASSGWFFSQEEFVFIALPMHIISDKVHAWTAHSQLDYIEISPK